MSDASVNRPPRRNRRTARVRRRHRLFPLIAALAATVAAAAIVANRSGSSKPGPALAPTSDTRVVLSARAAKPLPAPISGESVVGLPGGPLILGGLDASEASVSGVFQLDPGSGRLHATASLTGPLHDAAATLQDGQVLVFGGGAETSTDEVQALAVTDSKVGAVAARSVGRLPTVRSDLSALTVGGRAFVLGGYDGETPLESVLATSDGAQFEEVAKLPVPARYMATVALGDKIYAFGGETGAGTPTDAIQEIDPRSGSAHVVGHMPEPVSHAAAVVLGGRIYVLGGETGVGPTDRTWRFDPASGKVVRAGSLPFAVSDGGAATVGSTAYLIGGTGASGETLTSVVEIAEHRVESKRPPTAVKSTATTGRQRPGPFEGSLLIADRGNNRLLVVNAQKEVLWRFPSKAHPAPPGGFYFPDDAFFTHHGTQLISNEEQNERIVRLAFPSGRLLWSYGHPGVAGSEPGYLHEPDDAYLWRDGTVSVADAQNCRVLMISPGRKVLKELGEPSRCEHEPPRALGSPNGDTPLRDGNLLVSEVNGSYIDEITPHGKLVWSVQLPIEYPSDPQQLGSDRYLVADYTTPGGLYEFNRKGKILWSYHPSAGRGMLDHPSLAERLPGGLIAVNDDYRHRVVIVDPHTRRIVWQYGRTDSPGRGPDRLNTPDGFDLLSPEGTTPTHPYTG